jgi:sigma-B regulation protein RsbU (phosphoserine phosphatase)
MTRSGGEGTGDGRGHLLDLDVPARPAELKGIRNAVRDCLEGCGCSAKTTADIVLAIDEACQNIIRHAYDGGPDDRIELEIDRDGDQLIFRLIDFAPRIDPAKVRPRDLDDVRPGGLGTHFIRNVMDETEFLEPPSGRGNLLKMVRRID